jgi:hypothetical protein
MPQQTNDEGRTMTNHDSDPATKLRRLAEGYQLSQAIHVAATLGIADLLADTSRTSDDLAESTGTHPPTLYRLLRALASVDVLRELDGRLFELGPLGEYLRSDVPGSIAGWAAFIGRPYYWQAWAGLLHSVRTGENAFRHVHDTDVWTYRSSRPDESAIFDRAMTSLSRRSNAALLAAYDFGRFRTIVDVGGGNGALLAAIVAAHPDLQGVLFDQPHVVAGAGALLERAGVADRCRVIAGSFFESVPNGGDAYVLRAVIHDWEDEASIRILSVVRRAIQAEGTLLLIERVIAPPNEGRDAKLSDLNMLVGPGGRERTREEFAALLDASRFRLARVVGTGVYSVVEAVPA